MNKEELQLALIQERARAERAERALELRHLQYIGPISSISWSDWQKCHQVGFANSIGLDQLSISRLNS